MEGFASSDVAAIQALAPLLTRFGMVLVSLGLVFWGHALLHHKGAARWVAMLGMAAGGFAAAFMMTAPVHPDPQRLFGFVVLHAVWNATIAVWFMRGL